MRSIRRCVPTILHVIARRPHGRVAALLALTTMLVVLPGVADVQARSGGAGFGGAHGNFSSSSFSRRSVHADQGAHYKTTTTRRLQSRASHDRISKDRPHLSRPGRTAAKKRTAGHRLAVSNPPRPTGGEHPRPPRHPHRPIHHWPPVIVGTPPVTGIVVDSGSGGPPSRVIGNTFGGSGGAGGTPPAVTRRAGSGVPPSNERRYVPDEVVLELAPGITEQDAQAIAGRYGLVRLEAFTSQLSGTTLVRWRIPDRRTVPAVVSTLQADGSVISAQPNYLAILSDDDHTVGVGGDPAQYALVKLRMAQAHTLATGANVLVAVVDSGIDVNHPELAGMIADSYDAVGTGDTVHAHGTGIAGAIVAHAKLMGTAPAAKILAIRSFGATKESSEGTTYNISKGLNWAAAHGARVINMSFAGPRDPTIERDLAAAYAQGIVLVAAAGNAGPKSPPLYPAANPEVIAVSATDEDDHLFSGSNQGKHIAVAAPGVDIYLPAPGGIYQMTSGTSFSAAEVSGTAALLLQRRPDLSPQDVRKTLMSTARDLGPRGFDPQFGAGLVDAYKALVSLPPAPIAAAKQ